VTSGPVLRSPKTTCMTHAKLIKLAERWLRHYGCHIVLTEQTASSGEVPDVIGWKKKSRSVVLECKATRSDFFVDRNKAVRCRAETSMGTERYFFVPKGLVRREELPEGWGLLEVSPSGVVMTLASSSRKRNVPGVLAEMELLLASLRRVEIRIEPQTITEFLKWKHRLAAYNGGQLPKELVPLAQELEPSGSGESPVPPTHW